MNDSTPTVSPRLRAHALFSFRQLKRIARPAFVVLAALVFAALLSTAQGSAQAQTAFYGITRTGGGTGTQRLVSFTSAAPGIFTSDVIITGVQPGESIRGIDFRPSNRLLYGLGSTSRLYIINNSTGVATPVSATPFSTTTPAAAIDPTESYGFDFNPTNDRIRVVERGGTNRNFQLNPDNGQVVGGTLDSNVAFAGSDPNAGDDPNVTGSAFSNNFPDATSTTLYAIESRNDVLATQGPNNGVLGTVGSLGFDTNAVVGFDIEAEADITRGFAALSNLTDSESFLFRINLNNANSTNLGEIGVDTPIDGLAIPITSVPTFRGPMMISEFRQSGPSGADNEFIELYNPNDFQIAVLSSDGSAGWSIGRQGATCAATPVRVITIPNGTLIPARGHYLLAHSSGYGLTTYPAGNGTTATPDLPYGTGVPADRNFGLFNTATVANYGSATRLDGVGFGTNTGANCELFREDEDVNVPNASGSTLEYSFLRKLTTGLPQRTNNDAADFVVVVTTLPATVGDNTGVLGAPGPENTTSPINRTNGLLTPGLIDPNASATGAPNRVRNTASYTDVLTPSSPDGLGSAYTLGWLKTRRRYTNNTAVTVTRMRFRTSDITSGPAPTGTADIRLLTSQTEIVMTSNGAVVVQGLVLEQPPTQLRGGGRNSSVSCCYTGSGIVGERTVTLAQPLAPGQSIDVQFLKGVVQSGTFRFFVMIELLP